MSLEFEMRQVLLEMLVVSEGTTARWDPIGGGAEAFMPAGGRFSLYDEWAERWEACEEGEEGETLAAAREALQNARKGPESKPTGETAEQFAKRVVKDGEGWAVKEAAVHFRTSDSMVRKIRLTAGRDAEYGKPYVALVVADKNERALYLLGKGMSVRAVAGQVGLHPTQVQRLKARAA